MRSGALKVAAFSPSAAFSDSRTEKPWSSNPARRNRLIFGSSSITSTTLAGLFIGHGHPCGSPHWRVGQGNGSRCSLSLTPAGDGDASAVRPDKSGCDPKAETGSGNCGLMTWASERLAAKLLLVVRRYSDTFIGKRQK